MVENMDEGNKTKLEVKPASGRDLSAPKPTEYPEISARSMTVIKWLALAFVVAVFVVQYFSGYA